MNPFPLLVGAIGAAASGNTPLRSGSKRSATEMSICEVMAHFHPLIQEHKKNKKIHTRSETMRVGDVGDEANEGLIRNSTFNRGSDVNGGDDENTVWSNDKKGSFIIRTIQGTALITILLRQNEDGEICETFDGANRILAISEFLKDKLHIRYNGITFRFSQLPREVQKAFRDTKTTRLTLEGCTEQYACRVAADMNHGTPMSMGEHLNLLRGEQTALCNHFNNYVEMYSWAAHGDIGCRMGGVKLIALTIMHIEQNTPIWTEHQKEKVTEFFMSNNSVKNSTGTDAVFQALDDLITKWQNENLKITQKDLPKYLQAMEAAVILFSFHQMNIDENMIKQLLELTETIHKYSPSKLVSAYLDLS